jgi:hypothetical protein
VTYPVRSARTWPARLAAGAAFLALAAGASDAPPPQLRDLYRALEANRFAIETQSLDRAAVEGVARALDPQAALVPADQTAPTSTNAIIRTIERWPKEIVVVRFNALSVAGSAAPAAIQEAIDTNVVGIVMDLRGVGGDSLDAVDALAGLLVPDETPIYELRDGRGETTARHTAIGGARLPARVPVMLLIDGDTRGSAEVLAAVLRGHRGVMLIGAQTAGDPGVRSHLALNADWDLWIATSWVVPLMGADYYRHGVQPHVPVGTSAPEADDSRVTAADHVPHDHNESNVLDERIGNDPAMRRALDILLGLNALHTPAHIASPPPSHEEPVAPPATSSDPDPADK